MILFSLSIPLGCSGCITYKKYSSFSRYLSHQNNTESTTTFFLFRWFKLRYSTKKIAIFENYINSTPISLVVWFIQCMNKEMTAITIHNNMLLIHKMPMIYISYVSNNIEIHFLTFWYYLNDINTVSFLMSNGFLLCINAVLDIPLVMWCILDQMLRQNCPNFCIKSFSYGLNDIVIRV